MSKTFIQQAKTACDGELGYDIQNYGNFFRITIQETGDEEQFFVNESPIAYFNLGVLMERYRAQQAEEREKPKRGRPKKETVDG